MTDPVMDPVTDPGLASERTELAWSRSALSLLACGAATLKGVPHVTNGHPLTGAALLVLGGLVWLSGLPLARRRRGRDGRARRPAMFRDLAPVACGSALVGVAAFVIAALFPN
jgi:uncharacterized membrane protein YidH (DUF202 family)